jgi:hypothetical protein
MKTNPLSGIDLTRLTADRKLGMEMDIVIRDMRPEDARAFLEIHHAAVRAIAAKDYSPEVVDAWAPAQLTGKAVAPVRANPEGELWITLPARVASISWLMGSGWRG